MTQTSQTEVSWIPVAGTEIDLIEEYARHTGHANLIRESIDGLVGEGPPS